MIELTSEQLRILAGIFKKHVPDCQVLMFGSRIRGEAERFSDLDIAVKGEQPLEWRRLERLKDALSDSDLPFTVDVSDWWSLPEWLRARIDQGHEVLTSSS